MTERPPCPAEPAARGPLGRGRRLSRLAHVAFWTALFYLLAYCVAKLAEWLSEL